MVVKGKIRKKYIALRFSSFCLSQGYKQCTLATNDYHIVYSHIILNNLEALIIRKCQLGQVHYQLNSFHVTGLFVYPLQTENQNQRFSDVFSGYRKRSVA